MIHVESIESGRQYSVSSEQWKVINDRGRAKLFRVIQPPKNPDIIQDAQAETDHETDENNETGEMTKAPKTRIKKA
jgi:hypothetical protein